MVSATAERTEAARLPDGDVVGVLLTQHARIRDLFGTIRDTRGERRKEAFDELRALLAVHEVAEELVLRPASKKVTGEQQVQARNHEEAEAAEVLKRLESMDVDGPEFDSALADFERSVGEHADRGAGGIPGDPAGVLAGAPQDDGRPPAESGADGPHPPAPDGGRQARGPGAHRPLRRDDGQGAGHAERQLNGPLPEPPLRGGGGSGMTCRPPQVCPRVVSAAPPNRRPRARKGSETTVATALPIAFRTSAMAVNMPGPPEVCPYGPPGGPGGPCTPSATQDARRQGAAPATAPDGPFARLPVTGPRPAPGVAGNGERADLHVHHLNA